MEWINEEQIKRRLIIRKIIDGILIILCCTTEIGKEDAHVKVWPWRAIYRNEKIKEHILRGGQNGQFGSDFRGFYKVIASTGFSSCVKLLIYWNKKEKKNHRWWYKC